jgi:hypothetical protein
MEQPKQLAPWQAVFVGLFSAVTGVLITLFAAPGAISAQQDGAPRWVLMCCGVMFILLGAAVIVGHVVAGGAGPDGDLPAGTPLGIRLTQYVLGAGGVGCLAAIFAWIAFGPGPRGFAISLPFLGTRPEQGEMVGRTVFGMAGVMAVALLVGVSVRTIRHIRSR